MSEAPRDDLPAGHFEAPRPRIGVSACLLGQEVRMNGGHCRQRWLTDVLAREVDFVTICPEMEIGLPSPRPVMRLALTADSRDDEDVRLVVTDGGEDLTARMRAHAATRVEALAGMDLHGFILKKDSPSCGLFRVKHYDRKGSPSSRGSGMFAAALAARLPSLPMEEEGRLNDRDLRESFLIRIFALARWRRYLAEDGTIGGLVAYHTRYKMALLACAPAAYTELGRLVAAGGGDDFPARRARYETLFLQALSNRVSRGRHVNVLQHLIGFTKDDLSAGDKRELADVLARYQAGAVPRAAPLTLVRYLLKSHDAPRWAQDQFYLEHYTPQLVENEPA